MIAAYLLEQSYRHSNILADLPFMNVGDPEFVLKEISADEGDLGLLRFINERTIDQLLN